MPLKRIVWLFLGLLPGCKVAEVSTEVAVVITNSPPVATSASVSLDEGDDLDVMLEASDVDNNILTYTLVQPPRYGVLSGSVPNMNYEPSSFFYGEDSFQFKVSDGEFESGVATVSITVEAQNPIVYLSPTGDDLTGTVDDEDLAFQTVNAAYAEAVANLGGAVTTVHVEAAPGSYTGLTLSANFNSGIVFHSDRESPANLGGIYSDTPQDESGLGTEIGHAGWTIDVRGWDIELGNISSVGARPEIGSHVGGAGGAVTLTGVNLVAGAITVMGGGSATGAATDWNAGAGGSVTIGTTVAHEIVSTDEIYASGGLGGPLNGGPTATGNGGTVTINASASTGSVLADGGYNATGTAGVGGTVTVRGLAGDVFVRGGGQTTGNQGSARAGGTVSVEVGGVVQRISANGGSGSLSAGAGGTVTVVGTATTISATGGSAQSRSAAAGVVGGAGGTIVIGDAGPPATAANVGSIVASGGNGGATTFLNANGGAGGAGGTITVNTRSTTGTFTALGGNGGLHNGTGTTGVGGNGGDVAVTTPATYGAATLTGGSGSAAGTDGDLVAAP